jgi:hypothetical protein
MFAASLYYLFPRVGLSNRKFSELREPSLFFRSKPQRSTEALTRAQRKLSTPADGPKLASARCAAGPPRIAASASPNGPAAPAAGGRSRRCSTGDGGGKDPQPYCRTCGRGRSGILRLSHSPPTAALYAGGRAPAGPGSPRQGPPRNAASASPPDLLSLLPAACHVYALKGVGGRGGDTAPVPPHQHAGRARQPTLHGPSLYRCRHCYCPYPRAAPQDPPSYCRTCGQGRAGALRSSHAPPTAALYAGGRAPAGHGSPRHGTSAQCGEHPANRHAS